MKVTRQDVEIEGKSIERFFQAATSPKFTHARARNWCGHWVVAVYHRDDTSPTGVIFAAGLDEEYADPILDACRRPGALSPTEPR